jgi:hypothetical protein
MVDKPCTIHSASATAHYDGCLYNTRKSDFGKLRQLHIHKFVRNIDVSNSLCCLHAIVNL